MLGRKEGSEAPFIQAIFIKYGILRTYLEPVGVFEICSRLKFRAFFTALQVLLQFRVYFRKSMLPSPASASGWTVTAAKASASPYSCGLRRVKSRWNCLRAYKDHPQKGVFEEEDCFIIHCYPRNAPALLCVQQFKGLLSWPWHSRHYDH